MNDAPTTPDPIEIAMEAEASGQAPTGVAHEVLRKQSRLLGWQAARERAAFALTLAGALVGVAVAVMLGSMVWRATHADGVVVRPFTTPADLAADGLTGEALAARVLDHIEEMRRKSGGSLTQTASGFSAAGGDGLRLEIPQTGISIGELDAYLRRWLGHERSITGALARTGDVLTLTVRYAGEPTVVVRGPASDPDGLIAEAADEVFGLADPTLAVLAQPMTPQGHDRAMAIMARLRASRDRTERIFGYGFSADQIPDPHLALAYIAEARRLGSKSALNYREESVLLLGLGRWEASRTAGLRTIAALKRDGEVRWMAGAQTSVADGLRTNLAILVRDYAAAEAAAVRRNDPALGPQRGFRPVAPMIAGQHDIARARAELARAETLGLQSDTPPLGEVLFAAGDYAGAAAAYASASAYLDDLDATARAAGWPQSGASRFRRIPLMAERAMAMAEAGDVAGAATLIGPTPADCYPCILVRARIAWLRGDLAAAERAYAEAARLGPSLPMAHEAWARLALARGQPARAASLARLAEARGPRWADPVKLEADALAATGDLKASLARYDAALRLAPAWADLRRARAALAARITP